MSGIQIVRFEATADQMRQLVVAHRESFPKTEQIELEALRALEAGLARPLAMALIESVCAWGNYAGIAGRVRVRNSASEISARLSEAIERSDQGRFGEGVNCIAELRGLGFSFASKVLRFLRPDHAVVLDSVISEGLGFARNVAGYDAFRAECARIADLLNAPTQPNPDPSNRAWRLFDVEMAIYAKFRGL